MGGALHRMKTSVLVNCLIGIEFMSDELRIEGGELAYSTKKHA